MALTADRSMKGAVDGQAVSGLLDAVGIEVFDGAIACFDSDGFVVPCDNTVAEQFWAGICSRGGLRATANDPQVPVVVERRGTRWLPTDGTVAATHIGLLAYVVDDEHVNIVNPGGASSIVAGQVLRIDVDRNWYLVDLEWRDL